MNTLNELTTDWVDTLDIIDLYALANPFCNNCNGRGYTELDNMVPAPFGTGDIAETLAEPCDCIYDEAEAHYVKTLIKTMSDKQLATLFTLLHTDVGEKVARFLGGK